MLQELTLQDLIPVIPELGQMIGQEINTSRVRECIEIEGKSMKAEALSCRIVYILISLFHLRQEMKGNQEERREREKKEKSMKQSEVREDPQK